MAIQTINLGNYANDGTGDDLRVAFTKVNANFAALDSAAAIVNGVNLGSGAVIFAQKDSTNLQFKTLTSTNSSVAFSSTDTTVNLTARTKLQDDISPTLGANLNLNNHYVYGGDIQSTVYGYSVPASAMLHSLLVESNNLNVDLGSFLTPTGYETDGLAGRKGYLLDYGLFSDAQINDELNFGTFNDHTVGGIGQITLAGNLTTTGAYNLTLATTANTSLTLPTSGTLTTTANNLSAFAATTSAQLASVISDATGTGNLVFSINPTISGASLTNGATISSGSLTFSGAISAPAWTTSGIRHVSNPNILTDTTSTGTVANAYTNSFGGNTIAATNATTYTNYATMFVNSPTAGTNVTFTNTWSIITAGNILLRGSTIDGPASTTAFPSATTLSIGASSGTLTIGNATITATNATALNLNGTSPAIVTSDTGTVAVFNTNALTGNLFGAATSVTIGAASGTLNLRNATITAANATALNLNGASPGIATSSTGTASVFNTNALTGNLFGAATTISIGNASGTTTIAGRTSTTNLSRSGLEIVVPNYITVSSTTTYALSTTVTENILLVTAGALTATLTFPSASLIDGQRLRFTVTTNTVTLALTAGPTLVGTFAGSVTAPTTFTYVYRTSNTTWYRI